MRFERAGFGDTVGILIVPCLAKGTIALADRYVPAGHFMRRRVSRDGTKTR
jgi:hypothetical protein